MLTDDSRPGEEKEELLTLNLQDLVVLTGNDVDVIATAKNKLSDLLENTRRFLRHRMPDDAIERRLHRTGRDFERWQKVGANTDRHDNRDQNHFAILPPMRFPRHRRELVEFRIQLFSATFNLFSVVLAQRRMKSPNVRGDRIIGLGVQNIALVAQIFLGVAEQQFAVFNVARREHELNDEARMSRLRQATARQANVETMTKNQGRK